MYSENTDPSNTHPLFMMQRLEILVDSALFTVSGHRLNIFSRSKLRSYLQTRKSKMQHRRAANATDQLWMEKESALTIRSPREPTLRHQVFTWEAAVLKIDEDPDIRANAGPVTARDHEVVDLKLCSSHVNFYVIAFRSRSSTLNGLFIKLIFVLFFPTTRVKKTYVIKNYYLANTRSFKNQESLKMFQSSFPCPVSYRR